MSIPHLRGDYYYFNFNKGMQDSPITYKMKNKNERMFNIKQEDILKHADIFFDANVENKAKNGKLSGTQFSEDGNYMSYMIK